MIAYYWHMFLNIKQKGFDSSHSVVSFHYTCFVCKSMFTVLFGNIYNNVRNLKSCVARIVWHFKVLTSFFKYVPLKLIVANKKMFASN